MLNLLATENSEQKKEITISGDQEKKYLNFEKGNTLKSTNQMKNITQTKSEISPAKSKFIAEEPSLESVKNFDQLIKLVSKKREIELKYDLERNVNLVKFSEGKIDINFNEKLSKSFIRNLSEKLFEWTGRRWVISLTREKGEKTYIEKNLINKKNLLEKEKEGELYKNFKKNFPDAELIEVIKKD